MDGSPPDQADAKANLSDEIAERRMEAMLSHGRELFIYHAGQRLTALEYVITFVGALSAGYAALMHYHEYFLAALLPTFAIALTHGFQCLEFRNKQLVKRDEEQLKALEKQYCELLGVAELEIMKRAESCVVGGRTYGKLLPAMFNLLKIASAALFAIALISWMF